MSFFFKSGEIWNGVGHIAPGGKGERNDFGKAFKAQGEVSLYLSRYLQLNFRISLKSVKCIKYYQ